MCQFNITDSEIWIWEGVSEVFAGSLNSPFTIYVQLMQGINNYILCKCCEVFSKKKII